MITFPPVRTTCPYCGVGCGVLATPDGARVSRVDVVVRVTRAK